jgi:hypothetical protein
LEEDERRPVTDLCEEEESDLCSEESEGARTEGRGVRVRIRETCKRDACVAYWVKPGAISEVASLCVM